ncbi:MAG: DUF3575 domain-containing protein [Bacteroidaceae bacterium]
MKRKILAVLCLMLFLTPLQGKEQPSTTDSLYVFRFVAKKEMFYVPWKDNSLELERLCTLVRQHKQAILEGTIPLVVKGYCYLPQQPKKALRLARQRSLRVKSELISREKLTEACFATQNYAEKTEPHPHVVTVSLRIPLTPRERPSTPMVEVPPTALVAKPHPTRLEKDTFRVVRTDAATASRPSTFALRANLLRWATLTPDLGLEWRLHRQISMLVRGTWTSWSWNDKDRRYALWCVSPEVRYAIGKQKRGFVGAMYHFGAFHYKFGKTGKQGNYQGGGITGGYRLPLSNTFSLEFHLGAGYTFADYDNYVVDQSIRVRCGNETKKYWGINQFGITWIWNIAK